MAWPQWLRRKTDETRPSAPKPGPTAPGPERVVGLSNMALDRELVAMGLPVTAVDRQLVRASAHARAVLSDHPAVGLGPRTDATAAGGSARLTSLGFTLNISPDVARLEGPETAEALPVLLVETRSTMLVDFPQGRGDAQVVALATRGFNLWSDGPMMLGKIPDWSLSRPSPERLELHGPGGCWAHTTLTPDPQWLAAAVSQREALVLFGPSLGVRAVNPNNDYSSESSRKAELDMARSAGLVCAGIVTYTQAWG